jgi:hypothetical protein
LGIVNQKSLFFERWLCRRFRNMKNCTLITFLVLLGSHGCGADCEPGDRVGMYLLEYEEISGDCGPMASSVVRLGEDDVPGCSVLAESWSKDQCTYESSVACEVDGASFKMTASTTQQDSDGSEITGTATAEIRDSSTGDLICFGTYDVSYTRQGD